MTPDMSSKSTPWKYEDKYGLSFDQQGCPMHLKEHFANHVGMSKTPLLEALRQLHGPERLKQKLWGLSQIVCACLSMQLLRLQNKAIVHADMTREKVWCFDVYTLQWFFKCFASLHWSDSSLTAKLASKIYLYNFSDL